MLTALTLFMLFFITIALIAVSLNLGRLLRAFSAFHQDYLRIHDNRRA